jgi:UDP-glucose:(heptosyl)LPS alpha-1,3-glucosyltransferase
MKKIALALENFSRYGGGAESYAISLAAFLIKNGWEVHFFGETWDGEPEKTIFHKIAIPKYLPAWLKLILFALHHKRAVKKQHFDVILGFGNTLYMNVYQSHGGVHWLSSKRQVYSERNEIKRAIKRLIIILSLKQWARAWIESAPFRLYPRPRIVAISQMIKKDISSFFKVNDADIIVVYNGVDTSRYEQNLCFDHKGPLRRKLGIREDDVVFLFVSYELKKKGIETLVEAASRLKLMDHRDFKVVVVGGMPYKALLRQIKIHDIEDKILFTGPVRSIETYYANADAFVLPTYYDACSLVVIEAMASGLPIITTTSNGASGIINDGMEGYIISHPPRSRDLAKTMQLLLDDEKRHKMSQEALRTGLSYSEEKNHREMVRIFGEVAALKAAVRVS